ncbi:MAG: hypothetical protein LBK57_01475 [Clostridiales Family XIII bacterium]|jgi:hypothetical protein|nr:hypothetical protein [Clostridiales Family XIII bacterium]
MKELLKKKLNNVKDLEQRKALKELIDEFLLPMAEYQDERWEELVSRVANEIRPRNEQFCDIVMGLCGKDEYDPAHSYLFPILPFETLNLSSIETSLKDSNETHAPVTLFSAYIDETWERVLEILSEAPVFDVNLRTNDGASVNGSCCLVPDEKYKDALRDVYRSFEKNGLPWNTVCTAYIDRMASAVLTECEPFPADATLAEINVNFGDAAHIFRTDMAPLWNIARLEMKCNGAIFPLEDNVTFEHYIEIESSETEHGYLVAANNEYVRSVRKEGATLIITTNDAKGNDTDVYKIVHPRDSQTDAKLPYPLFLNRRRSFFTDMLANRATNVFTYAEVMRIISSYSFPLTVRDIKVTDEKYPSCTRGTMNFALDDAFSHINTAQTLCVSFDADEKGKYTQDTIRFLMSELQMRFPVYLCVGVLL